MPVELIFDTPDAAPEALRQHLVEADGKHVFKGKSESEIAGLTRTMEKLRDFERNYKALEPKWKKFEPFHDLDEAGFDELLNLWDSRGQQPKDKTEFAEMQKRAFQLERDFKKANTERETYAKQAEAMSAKLREYELWTPLRDIADKAGLDPKNWKAVRAMLAMDGVFGLEDGEIIVLENGKRANLEPDEFFGQAFKAQYPQFYKPENKPGTGATNNPNGGNPDSKKVSRATFNAWPAKKQMEFSVGGGELTD